MKVNTFHDGDRFIVVFEGLENKTSEEAMIKAMLSSVTECSPANVTPLNVVDEIPDIPVVFEGGPYKGLKPCEILDAYSSDGMEAYSYICKLLKSGGITGNLFEECNRSIKDYLSRRFAETDGIEYAKKFGDNNIKKFFEIFDYSIPAEMKSPTRDNIPKIINFFK